MTFEPDEVQRAMVRVACDRLMTETQRLTDILLRQKLTLTLNLFREQLSGKVRPRRAMALVRRPTATGDEPGDAA